MKEPLIASRITAVHREKLAFIEQKGHVLRSLVERAIDKAYEYLKAKEEKEKELNKHEAYPPLKVVK
jgi:hypothetical protein